MELAETVQGLILSYIDAKCCKSLQSNFKGGPKLNTRMSEIPAGRESSHFTYWFVVF